MLLRQANIAHGPVLENSLDKNMSLWDVSFEEPFFREGFKPSGTIHGCLLITLCHENPIQPPSFVGATSPWKIHSGFSGLEHASGFQANQVSTRLRARLSEGRAALQHRHHGAQVRRGPEGVEAWGKTQTTNRDPLTW